MTRIVHCKTWWDSHDWNYRAAESVQRELSCMAGFAQRELSSAARSCPAEAAREGWQDLHDSRHRVR